MDGRGCKPFQVWRARPVLAIRRTNDAYRAARASLITAWNLGSVRSTVDAQRVDLVGKVVTRIAVDFDAARVAIDRGRSLKFQFFLAPPAEAFARDTNV